MVNSVRPVPNHYETLGLSPAATDAEISQAFARKMSECRWDPMGPSALLCMAYETLSNRFKRADYDRAHGLEPRRRPGLSTMTVKQQRWAPFIASMPTNALGQAASEAAAMPHLTEGYDPEVPMGSKRSSLIAASQRELARPAGSGSSADVRQEQQKQPRQEANLEKRIQEMLATRPLERTRSRDFEDRQLDWKRPALAVGGCLVAAAFIGAFAGLSLKDDESSAHAETPAIAAAPARQSEDAAAKITPLAQQADMDADRMIRPARAEPRARPARSRYSHSWYAHSRRVRRPFEIPVAESGTVGDQPNADVTSQVTTKGPVAPPIAADGPSPH